MRAKARWREPGHLKNRRPFLLTAGATALGCTDRNKGRGYGLTDHEPKERPTMTTYYANPDETTFTGATYTFSFGAYGDTHVVVFQRPDHIDDALETAAECLAEHEPGRFSEPDYADAAREIGVALAQYTNGLADLDDDTRERILEVAEADHTYTESGWLLSHEWSVSEAEGEPFATPVFNRFDICQAHATYQASWHHGGQGYRDLCRATALCTNAVESFDDLSENGQAIYRALVLKDGR